MTRSVASRLALPTLAAVLIAAPAGVSAREHVADPPQARPLTSLANLAQQARDRVSATPRAALHASVTAKSLGSPRRRRSSARSVACRARSSRWRRCRTPCCSRARSRPRSGGVGLRSRR